MSSRIRSFATWAISDFQALSQIFGPSSHVSVDGEHGRRIAYHVR